MTKTISIAALIIAAGCGAWKAYTPPPVMARWTPVSSATSSFKYSGDLPGYKTEQHADDVPLPISYRYSALEAIPGGAVQRGVCALQNRTAPRPVFWFAGDKSIEGAIPSAGPQEFHLYQVGTHVKGLSFTGEFDGGLEDGASGYPVEAVFFTDRECTDAGREFGFARFLWENKTYFYFSDFTNCEGAICRVDQNGAMDAAIRPDVFKVEIGSLPPGQLTFRAALTATLQSATSSFDVEVSANGVPITCSFGSSAAGPCRRSFPIAGANPKSFYGYGDLEHGYLDGQNGPGYFASVIQTGGATQFTEGSGMTVNKLEVAK